MEFFVVHLTAYFICFCYFDSGFFSLWLCKCAFFLFVFVFLLSILSQTVSRKMQSIFLGVKSLRIWASVVFREFDCFYSFILMFTVPSVFLAQNFVTYSGEVCPRWMLHKEHVSLAISQLQHPYISCKPGLSKCLLQHQQSYALSN